MRVTVTTVPIPSAARMVAQSPFPETAATSAQAAIVRSLHENHWIKHHIFPPPFESGLTLRPCAKQKQNENGSCT